MVFVGDVFLKDKVKIDFDLQDVILNYEYTYPLGKGKNKVLLATENNYLLDSFSSVLGVNLANNHIFDYEKGIDEVLKFLEKNNISYCGIDDKYIKTDKYNIYGFCSKITNPMNDTRLNILEDNNFEFDFSKKVIVILHWGYEEYKMPRYEDRILAHKLIDMGVEMIIGHHPHIIQPVEVYKNKYIFYSLGNFIFPDLEEKSFFDGKDFKIYKEKRSNRNKYGLVVKIDENIEYFTTYFNENIVSKKSYKIPIKLPNSEKDFFNYHKYYSKFLMLENFIKNPRIPNFNNLKNFIGLK